MAIAIMLVLIGAVWAVFAAWAMLALTGQFFDIESKMVIVYLVVGVVAIASIIGLVRIARGFPN